MKWGTTAALAAIAAGLFAYIMLVERHSLSDGELEERKGHVLKDFIRDKVSRIEIQGDGEAIVLERKDPDGDGEMGDLLPRWELTLPVRDEADSDAVDTLLGAVQWADARRTLKDVTAEDLARFGLVNPGRTVTFHVADRTASLRFGDKEPRGAGYYAQVDENTVVVVGQDVFEAADPDPSAYREKAVFRAFPVVDATSITWREAGVEARLEKRDQQWWVDAPSGLRGSNPGIENLLSDLGDLRAVRFVEGTSENVGGASLANPIRTIEIGGADGGVRVRIGETCDGEPSRTAVAPPDGGVGGGAPTVGTDVPLRMVRVDTGPVLCVEQASLDKVLVPVTHLVQERLLAMEEHDVVRLTVTGTEGKIDYRRTPEGRWMDHRTESGGDPEGADGVDPVAGTVIALDLQALHQARFDEVGELPPGEGVGTIRIEGEAMPPEELVLYRVDADGAWIRRGAETKLTRYPVEIAPLFKGNLERFRTHLAPPPP
ncbi:MAG: DUF4340 domain-containing protein [Myxococcales bacterium]|nr:DUF4340 domain-containing protein [Myxococcales bacterium]